MEEEELIELKNELEAGRIISLLNDRLKECENRHLSVCATCQSRIDLSNKPFTLIFGYKDFRQKATFCAIDCLEYFLGYIKQNWGRTK
jgi:hypothetical protein